ncbi:MAG: hypothetical protein ACYC5S_09095 [Thiobacillus sp.]
MKPVALAAALLFSQGAAAHSDEYLDTQTAPHGGQLRMVGQYHYELVVKAGELSVYVTDHGGKKIATEGASGTATLLSSKGKASVKLAPAGDNPMKGSGKFALAPDMKVVVSLALAGEPTQQGRFTPLGRRTRVRATWPRTRAW